MYFLSIVNINYKIYVELVIVGGWADVTEILLVQMSCDAVYKIKIINKLNYNYI